MSVQPSHDHFVRTSTATLTGGLVEIDTRAAGANALATSRGLRDDLDTWLDVIENQFLPWVRRAKALEDDEFEPPSPKIVALALSLAQNLRDSSLAPPTRIIPDGEGGIVFERHAGTLFESLRLYSSGTAELDSYEDGRLVSTTTVI